MVRSAARAAAIALFVCLPMVALAAETLTSAYALPDGQPKDTATLVATPGWDGLETQDIAMTALGQQHLVTKYESELSKQMHIIAVSGDFRSFVHEHGERLGVDERHRTAMRLPHPGFHYVYADGVPAGLRQQVMRFQLNVDDVPTPQQPSPPVPSSLEAADGRYTARFASFELSARQERQFNLHLSRDGQPAPDLTAFLGVAAHAMFIGTADLTYVHVRAAPADAPEAGGTDAPMQNDPTKTSNGAQTGHHDLANVSAAPLTAGARVPSDLTLHVLTSKAWRYLLWIQFMAGGQVWTVPFVVVVA